MITTFEMGWHRIQAIKNIQVEQKLENYEMIDKEVYLKNGIRVNVEYTEKDSFVGLVTKGNNGYKKDSIIRADFSDIDTTEGKAIPINHELINEIADKIKKENGLD